MTTATQPFLNARIDLDLAQLHLRHAAIRDGRSVDEARWLDVMDRISALLDEAEEAA